MKSKFKTVRLIISIIKRISWWLEEHRIRVYASQAAFFIIISALPMMILILSITGLILPVEKEFYNELLLSLPSEFQALAEVVLSEISVKSGISVLSISALTLLWSASAGVRGIGSGIRNVYGAEKDRNYFLYIVKSLLMTLLYVASVILALAIWVFGDFVLKSGGEQSSIGFVKLISSASLFMILSAVFMLTYRFFGAKKSAATKTAPGAFFSAVGWLVFSQGFEFYIKNFSRYSYVYGSLGALIAVMLWLYFCMEILLIGAKVNVMMSKKVRLL